MLGTASNIDSYTLQRLFSRFSEALTDFNCHTSPQTHAMSTRRAALSVNPGIRNHSTARLTMNNLRSLYRRSLKLALDWAVQRSLWRGQALYIRSLFEANRHVSDPRQQRVSKESQYGNVTHAPTPILMALLGTSLRNRKTTRKLETPRSLCSANSTRRCVTQAFVDCPLHRTNRSNRHEVRTQLTFPHSRPYVYYPS